MIYIFVSWFKIFFIYAYWNYNFSINKIIIVQYFQVDSLGYEISPL